MTRISKITAEEVAVAMTQKQRERLNNHYEILKKTVTSLCLDRIGADMWKMYKEKPGYFKSSNQVSISGLGWNNEIIDTTERIPATMYSSQLAFESKQDEKAANALRKEYDKYDKAMVELRKLKRDIANTLFALKSLKAISEHLPEALPFLPKTFNTSVIIDTDSIRSRLK